MRQIRFGWLLPAALLALSAGACGDTEGRKPSASASGGAGGEAAGAASEGGAPTAGAAPKSGSFAAGGEAAGEPGGAAGASGQAGANDAGAGGAATPEPPCSTPGALAILGDYAEPNGDELWLRDSGKAVTLTRVPAGKPALAKPPRLWLVVQACSSESALLLQNGAGDFTRLDYFQGATSLTACLSTAATKSAEQARQLPAADRSNTIDAGCNGGPWTRFVKEEK